MDEEPSTLNSPGGDPRVAEVIGDLDRLDQLEVEQHVTVFETTHARLRSLLTDQADPAPAAPGSAGA